MKPALPPALQAFWQARDARERRALKLLAAFIAAALLIQTLWSIESARQRNLRQLPQLAAKAEWMRQAVDDWQRQSAQNTSRPPLAPDVLQREVQQRSQPLGNQLKAEWRNGDSLHLSGQVPFDAWIKLLAELHHDLGLVVRQAQVTAASTGLANIDAELQLARSSQ